MEPTKRQTSIDVLPVEMVLWKAAANLRSAAQLEPLERVAAIYHKQADEAFCYLREYYGITEDLNGTANEMRPPE